MTQLFPEWIISKGSTDLFHQDAPSELGWQLTDINEYSCIWQTNNKPQKKRQTKPKI